MTRAARAPRQRPVPLHEVATALDGAATSRVDLIRASARKHFAQHGYEAASMREIAADAGITIATLYFHCTTKEQLLFDVLMDSMQRLQADLDQVLAKEQGTWSDRLGAALACHIRYCARGDFGAAINTTELRALSGAFREQLMAARDTFERRFRDLVAGGIAAGEFAPADVPVLTAGLIGIGFSVGRWFRPGGRLSAEQVADEYVRFALRGLRATPASSSKSATKR